MDRTRLNVSFLACFIVKIMEIKGFFHNFWAERGEHTRGTRRNWRMRKIICKNLTISHHALKLNCITLYHLYYQDLLKIKKSLGNGCFPAQIKFYFPSSYSQLLTHTLPFVFVFTHSIWAQSHVEDFFRIFSFASFFASSFFFASLSVETFRGN